MAGESKGAARHSLERKAAAAKRRKLLDKVSTDKYYASGDVSAVGKRTLEGKGRPGDPVVPNPTPKMRSDERSADKKYYASQSQAPTAQQVQQAARKSLDISKPPKLTRRPKESSSSPGLVIRSKEDINAVFDNVSALLLEGVSPVVVEVADDKMLLRRSRARLESLVTRELITEDHSRDVVFSKIGGMQPPLEIAHVVPSADTVDMSTIDPASILDGVDLEETFDTAPTTAVEAEVEDEDIDDDVDDVLTPPAVSMDVPEIEQEEAATPTDDPSEDEDDDSDDVLTPPAATHDELDRSVDTDKPVRVEDEASDETPSASVTPKRPGRRSGRGS